MENEENSIKAMIDHVVGNLSIKLTQEDGAMMKEALVKVFDEGMVLKNVMHVADKTVNALYSIAYHNYNNGKYNEAIKMLDFLIVIDVSDKRFQLAIAACYLMLKKYKEATGFYKQCTIIDKSDPLPYYYMYECYYRRKHYLYAASALKYGIQRAKGNPDYSEYQKKFEFLLDRLKVSYPDELSPKTDDKHHRNNKKR